MNPLTIMQKWFSAEIQRKTEYDGKGNLTSKADIVNEFDSQGNGLRQTVLKWNTQSGAWDLD